jgi:4-hydroxybenzoate polyprenyltransferase
MKRFFALWLNHFDAWGSTLVIASAYMIAHGHRGPSAFWLLLAMGVAAWLAFAINDYFDSGQDSADARKAARNFFVGNPMPKAALMLLFGLPTLFVLLAFAQYGWLGMGLIAVAFFAMVAYSARPLRLKARPGLDLLTHTIFIETSPYLASLILLGGGQATAFDVAVLVMLALSSLAAQLEQQLRDYPTDKLTNTNFTVCYGPPAARTLLRAATLLLVLWGGFQFGRGVFLPQWWPIGLFVLPLLLHRLFNRQQQGRPEALLYLCLAGALLYMAWLWGVGR